METDSACLIVWLVGSIGDVRYSEVSADVVLAADNIQVKQVDGKGMLVLRYESLDQAKR